DQFGLNPLGAIASGALLICAAPGREPAIRQRLARAGVRATRIGSVVPAREGVRLMMTKGRSRALPRFPVDEIARLFANPKRKAGGRLRLRSRSIRRN
ncbi:MAG: hypothetical protein ACE5NA_10490, partial [Nitrospiraceae bacterium]